MKNDPKGLYTRLENWRNTNKKKLWYAILKLFIIVLIIGGILGNFAGSKLNDWYTDFTAEEEKYVSVIITNKSDESFTIPQEFRRGFTNVNGNYIVHNNKKVEFKLDDDALDPDQAEILANKYVNDPNCIMIIGNSTSTLSEITLNKILETKGEKPAFLLPIATADDIIDKAKDQEYKGILRMMPNNEKQAITIKNFIFHKCPEKPRVLIYVDEDNLTYSKNLSQKIADKVIKSQGTIVLKKNYGNSNRLINDYNLLKSLEQIPDMIVFVGISTNGSLLMEEAWNLGLTIPIVYTDGCTVNSLMKKSRQNPNNYFVSAVEKSFNGNSTPTYEPVGFDTKGIAVNLIRRIKENINRKSLNNVIYEIRANQDPVKEDGRAGKYSFDNNGENTELSWKLYNYVNGQLVMEYEID